MKIVARVASIALFFGVLALMITAWAGFPGGKPKPADVKVYMEQALLAPASAAGVQTKEQLGQSGETPIKQAVYAAGAGKQATSAAAAQAQAPKAEKKVYLTFDDGPSDLTLEVLDILRKEGIKGTFFVLGEQAEARPEIINRIYEEGHVIGNHTYDHRYDKLYGHFQDFWTQIKKTEEVIRLITGERPQLVRAPGGTAGHFDQAYFDLMEQGGYRVFDWNVDSGDSKRRGVPAKEIVKGATAKVSGSEAVVLLHDSNGHEESVKALPEIIAYYKKQGYAFDVLTPDMQPVQFKAQQSAVKASQPSRQWIEDHVAANAKLFETGRTLALEFGAMETAFEPGEYKMEGGRLLVPLRSLTERLGGEVSWKGHSKTVSVSLGGKRWEADPLRRTISPAESWGRPLPSDVHLIGGTAWIPLRDALAASGHPVTRVTYEDAEIRIITL
ncbi:polysaccharide deacetylase [Paenibacillus ihbetae]|uniref:Polysaccharide deacetylase n=1 Tax=Paenibacillus ihbetae TaxID=1870820 RepID=A0A1B2DYZ7_9BACL|nr:polysaccharide deacetylase [Paenibacillus ihbetae]ANY72974.1 polysaccharide deacetylase [Paenibacillus ihbetae]OOC58886.1 polysaccharide deacetylase [Paenibacillus ihbetae]